MAAYFFLSCTWNISFMRLSLLLLGPFNFYSDAKTDSYSILKIPLHGGCGSETKKQIRKNHILEV